MSVNPDLIPETDESSDGESIPPEVRTKANEVINNLTPEILRRKYEAAYQRFMESRSVKKIKSLSETVLVTYFSELAETQKPSSLWEMCSMLWSMIDIKHKINIYKHSSLIALKKKKNIGFKSKKAQTLSAEQIQQFLHEAPDNQFFATEVN